MYSPQLEKRKQKIAWKRILILVLVIIMGLIAFINYRDYKEQMERNTFGICGLNNLETLNLIEETEDVFEIKDYLFYGETLNLYAQPYQLGNSDELYGKTITLRNICDSSEYVFILDSKIDGQIPLESLSDGIYFVYLNKGVKEYQLYTQQPIYEEFYTVTRDQQNKLVTVFSDQNMFNDEGDESYLQHNYLTIKVEDAQLPQDYYDIVLDAGHSSNDQGWGIEYGYQANGLIESDETYKLAVLLKDKLEASGLKVLLTRDGITDVIDSYGVDGRLYKGYMAHAKYYIDIQALAANNPNIRGTQVIYSSYSTNRLALMIMQAIANQTSLVKTGVQSTSGITSVLPSLRSDGYDGRMMLRESGGRILGAGTFSEASSINAPFNAQSRFGMQAVTIEYFYLTNNADVEVWNNELEKIVTATADGIKRYLRIE